MAQVHHVPALIVGELQVPLQLGLKHHLGHIELRAQERRGAVVIAVQGQHLQIGIASHGRGQVDGGVGGGLGPADGRTVSPVPVEAGPARTHPVVHVGVIVQAVGDIVIEDADIGAGDGAAGRVLLG